MTGEVREKKKKREITIDLDKIFGFTCLGISVISIVVAVRSRRSISGFSKELKMSLDDLRSKTHIEITDAVIDRFTEEAVEKAAKNAAKNVSDQVRSDMYDILSNKVTEAVSNQYDNIKDEVSKELRKKVNNISISALKAEIKDEATRKITDKLATEMDDILSAQTDKLENIAKAYKDMGEFIKNKA